MAKSADSPSRRLTRRDLQPIVARGRPFVLVASEFHRTITRSLVDGAQQVLRDYGVARRQIRTQWVPGVFELPVAAAAADARLSPEAVIALGCVIKGQTPQYGAIGQAAAEGLAQVSVSMQIPVTFGVIIAQSLAQAAARAGGRAGHRGREAALAALAMVRLLETLAPDHSSPNGRRPSARGRLMPVRSR